MRSDKSFDLNRFGGPSCTPAEATAPPLPVVRSEELSALRPDRVLRGRNWSKADILVYRLHGIDVAVKDYAGRPWVVRHTVGRWFTRREARAYAVAQEAPCVPRFLGRTAAYSFALEWIDARKLNEFDDGAVNATLFDRLEAGVRELHRRGLALADLHRSDVLLTASGQGYVVDLAMSLRLGARPSRLRRRLYEHFCERDLMALARMRARFVGGDESEAVLAFGEQAAARYWRGKRLKRLWDRLRGRVHDRPGRGNAGR